METRLDYLPTSPFPRDPLALGRIYAGGAGPQLNNLDLEDDYHPFKVYVMSLRAQGSQARGKWGVEYKSVVYKDKNDFSNQTVTGLLTNRLDFQDAGWNVFPTQDDKIVYLKGTVSGGQVTAIDVDSDLTLTQLNTKKRITGSGSSQTEFICPIARLFRYGSNPQRLGVEQYVKTNLMLRKVSFGDDEGWYPCPGPAGGGGGVSSGPWDVSLSGVGDPSPTTGKYSSYKAIVNPGLVGGILPNNWQTEFTVGNGLSYMVADCQSNGRVVTSASISNSTSAPQQQAPGLNTAPGSFTILFAVVKDGAAIRTIREGHIAINPVISLSLQKSSPTPGLGVVDRYYVWGLL